MHSIRRAGESEGILVDFLSKRRQFLRAVETVGFLSFCSGLSESSLFLWSLCHGLSEPSLFLWLGIIKQESL